MSTYPPYSDKTQLTFDTQTRSVLKNFNDQEHTGQLLSHLIELAHDAILVRDTASVISSWNRGAEELYGWTAQEALGQVTHNLLQTRFPESREALDNIDNNLQGHFEQFDLRFRRKDGTSLYTLSAQVHQNSTPIFLRKA